MNYDDHVAQLLDRIKSDVGSLVTLKPAWPQEFPRFLRQVTWVLVKYCAVLAMISSGLKSINEAPT